MVDGVLRHRYSVAVLKDILKILNHLGVDPDVSAKKPQSGLRFL
jgi:hypothetical protein